MSYYSSAFQVAPELADPNINPEVTSSSLSLGAWLKMTHEKAFQNDLPMPFIEPDEVKKTRSIATNLVKDGNHLGDETGRISGSADDEPTAEPPGSGPVPLAPAATNSSGASSKQVGTTEETPGERGRAPASNEPKTVPTPPPKNDVPYGEPESRDDVPYGLPSTRGVSPEAYPGF
jgi:hypothetical protein